MIWCCLWSNLRSSVHKIKKTTLNTDKQHLIVFWRILKTRLCNKILIPLPTKKLNRKSLSWVGQSINIRYHQNIYLKSTKSGFQKRSSSWNHENPCQWNEMISQYLFSCTSQRYRASAPWWGLDSWGLFH